jgi:inhibitor of cysteine peptidase
MVSAILIPKLPHHDLLFLYKPLFCHEEVFEVSGSMKPRTVILTAAFIFCIFFLIQPSVARTINAGEADNGRMITAGLHDSIVLTLPENPSTGYLWDITATRGLTLLSGTFQRPSSLLIGAGGNHVWTYQVTGTGTQTLTGSHHRPWVPISVADRKYSLFVQIETTSSDRPAVVCPYGICKQKTYPVPYSVWPSNFGIFISKPPYPV